MQNQFDPRTTTNSSAGANTATVGVPRAARDAGLRSYMLSVYNYMASGVLLTGIVALLFAPYAQGVLLNQAGTGMSPLGWVITLSPLGFILAMNFGLHRMQTRTLQMLFWAFAAVMGLSMSTIFIVYTGVSIAQTFFAVTAANAQNSILSVLVCMRLTPKLIAKTNPSGAKVISQPRPLRPVPLALISTSRA